MIVKPNPVWAWVLLHFPDWRYQLPELGVLVKISSPTYMHEHSDLPPVFQAMVLKNQQSKDNLKVVKTLFGSIMLSMSIGALVTGEVLCGLSLFVAGLTLLPLTLEKLEMAFKFKLNRALKFCVIIGFTFIGIAFSFNDDNYRKPNLKSGSVLKSTTDSLRNTTDSSTITVPISKKTVTEPSDSVPTESDEVRKEKIDKQFSPWDGSHMKLVWYVKDRMNDPDSFEHIETNYSDKGSYLLVVMKYRGKNAFGAKVINYIKAKIDLEGEVLEIIDSGN